LRLKLDWSSAASQSIEHMSLSSGTGSAVKELALWAGVGVAAFVIFMQFGDATTRILERASGMVSEQPAGNGDANAAAVEGEDEDADDGPREVHLRAAENGHFFARIYVNGEEIEVLVDTGATHVALRYEDAMAIGLDVKDSDYTLIAKTANGAAKAAPITLDEVRIGDITVRDVEATIGQPGTKFITLLGMTFLSKLSRVDIRGKELVLVE
jgi:aspartyl protease family protein